MDIKKAAGIITYNPDLFRLEENVRAILSQIDTLIIVDNNSKDFESIKQLLNSYNRDIYYIQNNENVGVAKALNDMVTKALDLGLEWLLTLDQDSVVSDNLMGEYLKYVNNPDLGIITCRFIDRNTEDISHISPIDNSNEWRCITSGSYMNLKVWKEIGGFFEPLFIDLVDYDYCYTLREHGYRILRLGTPYIIHEIGNSSRVILRGRPQIAFNHSPLRCYYMIRNAIPLAKRHHMWKEHISYIIRRWTIINKFETNRLSKNRMMLLGLYHGLIGKLGRCQIKSIN